MIPTLDQIKAVDQAAASFLFALQAKVKARPDLAIEPPPKMRGLCVGRLNEILGCEDDRHLFTELAFGIEGGSSKGMSQGHCGALLDVLADGWEKHIRRIVEAARCAQGQKRLPSLDAEAPAGLDSLTAEAVDKLGARVRPKGAKMTENVQAPETTAEEAVQPTEEPRGERLHSEACVLAWAKLYDPQGVEWSITIREGVTGTMAMEMAKNCAALSAHLLKKGWTTRDGGARARQAAAHPMNQEPGPRPPAPAAASSSSTAPPPPPGASGGNGGNGQPREGTVILNKLTVNAEGQVEFHCQGFRWPLKDSRGAEVVVQLFDPDLGFTPEHFYPGAKYDNLNLVLDWAKPGKYRDVVRVRAS